MTQAELADRVGVTRQTIIAIEQGRYSPTLEMAFQIARVFRVPPRRRLPVPGRRRAARMTHPPSTRHVPGHTPARRPERSHTMSAPSPAAPSLPPRWFIRSFWAAQRAVYAATGGRIGLRTATDDHQGMMRLHTVGRRTGEPADRHPRLLRGRSRPRHHGDERLGRPRACLVAQPAGPPRRHRRPAGRAGAAVRARAAGPDERPRLWARWAELRRGSRRATPRAARGRPRS